MNELIFFFKNKYNKFFIKSNLFVIDIYPLLKKYFNISELNDLCIYYQKTDKSIVFIDKKYKIKNLIKLAKTEKVSFNILTKC